MTAAPPKPEPTPLQDYRDNQAHVPPPPPVREEPDPEARPT